MYISGKKIVIVFVKPNVVEISKTILVYMWWSRNSMKNGVIVAS